MNNLRAACLRRVLVLKRIEIFQSSSCIIRNWSHWGILKIQDIPNIIKMACFPELKRPRSQQTVSSQAPRGSFTLKILTANGFSESPANGLSSKFAMVKLPFYQGSKTGFSASNPRRSMKSSSDPWRFQVCAWVRGNPSCDLKCGDVISNFVAKNGADVYKYMTSCFLFYEVEISGKIPVWSSFRGLHGKTY